MLEGEAERPREPLRRQRRWNGSAATSRPSPRHPVVDIVPFQLLTLDLAEARGVDPDSIRWDDPRWKAARDAYA